MNISHIYYNPFLPWPSITNISDIHIWIQCNLDNSIPNPQQLLLMIQIYWNLPTHPSHTPIRSSIPSYISIIFPYPDLLIFQLYHPTHPSQTPIKYPIPSHNPIIFPYPPLPYSNYISFATPPMFIAVQCTLAGGSSGDDKRVSSSGKLHTKMSDNKCKLTVFNNITCKLGMI